jgi:hypothetical protein
MCITPYLKEDYSAKRPLEFEEGGTISVYQLGVPSVTQVKFFLFKILVKIAVVQKYRLHIQDNCMLFTMNLMCRNIVLKYKKSIW